MGCGVSVCSDPSIGSKEQQRQPQKKESYSVDQLYDRNKDFGSKNEIFFDSRAWLESDCEEDFFSVNGDFTPSRGSTPIHQTSIPSTPGLDKTFIAVNLPISKSEPSPTGRKKLAALLHETLQEHQASDEHNAADAMEETNGNHIVNHISSDQTAKSSNRTPSHYESNSVYGDEMTPKREHKTLKAFTAKATNCCLPSLYRGGSMEDEG